MIINYSDEKVKKDQKSIFLAGPTPRDINVNTWRIEAIEILKELGYDGLVYVPERKNDDRTYDYIKQTWWEREALYNANCIVFWIPRDIKTLPAFTTNVEFGYWISKNSDKIIYGRPDNSEKNRYLDWLYQTETGKRPTNNLKEILKGAIKMAEENKNKKDIDEYELNIIKNVIKKYPEITTLIGEVQFTPESFGNKSEKTYGQILFNNTDPNQLKEFDRTILSVLLYYYIKDNRYDKFVEIQSGDNVLKKETFEEIRKFMLNNFNTPEKEDLLLYYMVINDLGKSQKIIDILKEKGIESIDHDLLLTHLLDLNMLPSINNYSDELKQNLINVLKNGINIGQYIQGECTDYNFNNVLNLSQFERVLMTAEAMLDIGGVLGHINNKNGSAILNQSTTNNILKASDILSNCNDSTKIFDEFLISKANEMNLSVTNPKIRKAITKICLMMRLYNDEDIRNVEKEIMSNIDNYLTIIDEFNQSGYNNEPAILLYYSPALLSNANKYFKNNNSDNSIRDTLRTCLPFFQKILTETRSKSNNNQNGVITIMLRDAAMTASENPYSLDEYEIDIINENEISIKK